MDQDRFLIALGENIRRIRKSKGRRQEDIALECNCDKASLSRIEGGIGNPTILTLKKIAESLSVNIADFLPIHDSVK